MYTVWTICYNRDGSVNNETLEGEYTDRDEAFKKAEAVNGEVREHYTLDSMYENGYTVITRPTVRGIRALTGLSQQKFGDYYNIPLRTIQDWEAGVRRPPRYVVALLEKAVKADFSK